MLCNVFSVAVAVLLALHFHKFDNTKTHLSPFTSPMARLSDKYDFLIPMHPEVASSPRRAVQLVDAPIGRDARFVYDPTGAVTAFLSKNTKPLKVIGVAGTFR